MAAENLLQRQATAVGARQEAPASMSPGRLGDVKDAALLLKVSVKTIRRMIDLRRIPGVIRIGRLLRIDLELLGSWLDQGAPPLARFEKGGR